MEELNDAQKLINIIMRDLGFSRLIELSNYFQISNGSFHGWLKRDSVRTIFKYAKKFGIDEGELNYKFQNYNDYMATPISLFDIKKTNEPKNMDDVKKHLASNPPSKTFEKVQKILEYEAQKNLSTSPYSDFFQILFAENKDAIFQILNDKLGVENLSDEDKMRFIEDFDELIKHVVSPTAKLKMLERLRSKI